MKKPDETIMLQAVSLAKAMREKGKDQFHLAQVLLYLSERTRVLEEVLMHADYFLRFGMAERELTELRRLVEKIREEESRHGSDSSLLG
jgi:uncharacterized protein YbgA (DUF1722 family)